MNLFDRIQGDAFYLIDFYADSCAPCQLQIQILNDIQQELPASVEIIKIDVDKDKINTIEFDSMYQIMGVPTLMLFHQGKLLWKHSGVKFKEDLQTIIQNYVH